MKIKLKFSQNLCTFFSSSFSFKILIANLWDFRTEFLISFIHTEKTTTKIVWRTNTLRSHLNSFLFFLIFLFLRCVFAVMPPTKVHFYLLLSANMPNGRNEKKKMQWNCWVSRCRRFFKFDKSFTLSRSACNISISDYARVEWKS